MAETGEGLVFGSELKVLFAHPGVRREIDSAGLFHQLMQTMVPGTTAFAGVHQVQPGHYLRVRRRAGQLRVDQHRYWDMEFPLEGERSDGVDEQPFIDGVREQLVDAVQLRLEADVPVGCYLSGGIDSSMVVALMAGMFNQPVNAHIRGR